MFRSSFYKNSSAVTPDSSSDMNAVWPQGASQLSKIDQKQLCFGSAIMTGRHLKPNRYLKKKCYIYLIRNTEVGENPRPKVS